LEQGSAELSHCDKLMVSRKRCLPLENFVLNQQAAQKEVNGPGRECLVIGGLKKLAGSEKSRLNFPNPNNLLSLLRQ
jgi:hypothetical protein